MKETISEYAKIVIVMISFALMCVFLLGGAFFNKIGETQNPIENEVIQERQMSVLELLEERKPPTLIVDGNSTYKTGELIKLTNLITSATTKDENGVEKDIKNKVEIICDSEDYLTDSKSILPSRAGVYNIKYTVRDNYGLSTTVLVKLVIVD
jgi:hypothetical protein